MSSRFLLTTALQFALIYGAMRLHWLLGCLVMLVVIAFQRKRSRAAEAARNRGDISSYSTGSKTLDWALALAHPMAYHSIQGGFADKELAGADQTLASQLRPMVLHHLGMRTDLDDASIRRQLPALLRQRWFMQDLQRLSPGDDLHAAMAFACARVAFYVRCAHMLGWLDQALEHQVLLLNARRAQECFDSWLTYGQALARGRAQWLAHGRADTLGMGFGEDEVNQWVGQKSHPWHVMRWELRLEE
ncbi:DUF1266 domain-containing protein [Comamonas composti]|uniref:DUF1266 domain-containing protein n=1 Tax=Comamonas composti TaxID=408558 RepID=UPI0004146A4D|nr:DUF1266 domain-containing protein [Comamonas composti]